MGKPQRIRIKHPITQNKYEGTGEYTKEIHGEVCMGYNHGQWRTAYIG